MFNHVMVGSNNIERSKRFYDAVLGTLGVGEPVRNNAPSGHVRIFIATMEIAFASRSQSTVRRQSLQMEAL